MYTKTFSADERFYRHFEHQINKNNNNHICVPRLRDVSLPPSDLGLLFDVKWLDVFLIESSSCVKLISSFWPSSFVADWLELISEEQMNKNIQIKQSIPYSKECKNNQIFVNSTDLSDWAEQLEVKTLVLHHVHRLLRLHRVHRNLDFKKRRNKCVNDLYKLFVLIKCYTYNFD